MTDSTTSQDGSDAATSLDTRAGEKLQAFVILLLRWNRRMNLIARGDEARVVARHIDDALTLAPFLAGARIIDLGTGAGLPGIPLAVARGGSQFVLLDRSERRMRFVAQCVIELGLDNVEVVTADFDEYRAEPLFDTVVTRAVAPVERILPVAWRFTTPGGRILLQVGEDEAGRTTLPGIAPSGAGAYEVARKVAYQKVAVNTADGRQRFIWVIDKPTTETDDR